MQLVYPLTKPGSLVFIKHPKTFLNLCSLCFLQKTHLGKSKNETKALCQACFSQTCQQLSLANELKLPKSRVAHAYLFPNTWAHGWHAFAHARFCRKAVNGPFSPFQCDDMFPHCKSSKAFYIFTFKKGTFIRLYFVFYYLCIKSHKTECF